MMGYHGTMRSLATVVVAEWLIWVATFTIATVSIVTTQSPAPLAEGIKFTQAVYNGSIPENSLGKTFVTPASKMGIYIPGNISLKITYRILNSGNDIFKVEDYLLGDFSFLLVRTRSSSYGRLNRELLSQYLLNIEASMEDKNGHVYKTTADLIIYVSDVNDLQPLFDHKFYNVTVREDAPLHSSIAYVSAYDGDKGINAEIYYSVVEPTNYFAVHPTSGIVSLTRPLNYFLQKAYSFQILAQDRGPQTTQSYRKRPMTLSVTVQQVNYYPPEISITTLPTIIESVNVGIELAIVHVQDKDIGQNGKVHSLDVVHGNSDKLIIVQKGDINGEYRIKLVQNSREDLLTSGFNITLQAKDFGVPPLVTNKTLYIDVLNLNLIPKFTKDIYSVSVEEVAPINTPLLFVSLVDSQRKFDARFEIVSGNKMNLFKINAITGLISTAANLDAENTTDVELKVVVTNRFRNGQTNSQSTIVKVTIMDNNDNTPKFTITDNVSEIYIQENLPVGSSFFTVTAVDDDRNENGKVSYSIANAKYVPFEIEPFTGILKKTEVLDYETMRHSYKLKLRASDWGSPYSREAEMQFTIHIQDSNDNKPEFEKVKCSGYLSREATVNTELLIVPAIDFDISDVITYEIESGNEDDCFRMDPSTATLFLNCSLKYSILESRQLQVIATDGKHISDPVSVNISLVHSKQSRQLADSLVNIQCQETDIFQRLQDLVSLSRTNNADTDFGLPATHSQPVENHRPVFNDSLPKHIEVSESLPIDRVLSTLQAVDGDRGYNGMLVYVIKAGDKDGHFKVDMHTGGLLIMSQLDRETKDKYNLVIRVSDLGSPSMSTHMNLSVKVLDENDNPPKFEYDQYSSTLSENIDVNSTVIQVHASDIDLAENAELTYKIVSDTDHFSINPTSGLITVNKKLDRERYPVYTILVRASDHGSKLSLSSTATVTVNLIDVNDVVPQFTPDLYNVRVREDFPLEAVITVVTAADTDFGANGQVTYNLVYGEDFFKIDPETGVIRLIQKLDFEVQQVHNISVRAKDGGNPPLMSACLINVEIIDVNENYEPPVFENVNFFAHGYVAENEPLGTTVMFLTARDPDGDEGVSYSIRDGSGLGRFSIDNNGTITTSQVLDRETSPHYWLTVYAQDHGLVPLHTRLEVYIEVKDVNDNIPMTFDPVYYATIPENSDEPGQFVAHVQAFDLDQNPGQHLTYEITRYDPQHFFTIDGDTGIIRTTGKKLDRENRAVHPLEVTISDNGEPNLTYQTRVFVRVGDENDNRPQFTERLYRVQFQATPHDGADIPVFQVLAWDDDDGPNGELTFDIRPNKDDSTIFTVHPDTGMVSAMDSLVKGSVHHFVVRASDHGEPKSRKATAKVRVEVVGRPRESASPPRFISPVIEKRVMESDPVSHMVELLQAVDADSDKLWYSIVDGDADHQLYVGLEAGNLVVARRLDWETRKQYNLTIQVTDGVNYDNCTVLIHVIDVNDNAPLFSQASYHGEFPESVAVGTTLLTVEATDADDDRLLYTMPECCNSRSTLDLFRVDPENGDVLVKSPLDREVASQHNLTVMVRDEGTSSHRNYTRVTITVLDHNDHRPKFLADEFRVRVFETAAVGTSVVMVMAMDQDRGENAEITYSILSGNIGDMFSIDKTLGTIATNKELDRDVRPEYDLIIRATDRGKPPMSNTASVKISVTISDNAPPKFDSAEYMAELHENEPRFTNVYTMSAECRSSLIYHIIAGNEEVYFDINPNSGVVFTKRSVDFETNHFFNLTIKATSIIHATAVANLLIHIIDMNDNAPVFKQNLYIGNVAENAKRGTVVLNGTSSPLVIQATDQDTNQNALLTYEIRDEHAKEFVAIDPNTGAIRTVVQFDHETVSQIEFSVEVWDMGKPQQRTESPAKVLINITDVNDSPPKFSMDTYTTDVLLPTYKDVLVIQLNAADADTGVHTKLKYSIIDGNEAEKFSINEENGEIFIISEHDIAEIYVLTAEVSDGIFTSTAQVNINVRRTINSSIKFSKDIYYASVMENNKQIETLTIIQVIDNKLNELFTFSLLNGKDMFTIGTTSGVLRTTGRSFDREMNNIYHVVVEVRKESEEGPVKAHAVVEVAVEDENDNDPMFVQRPYHAVIVYDSRSGDNVKQVNAIDQDSGVFGQVTYRLKYRGDLDDKFAVDAQSGQITVSRPLVESDVGKEIMLLVVASDAGTPPRTAESTVKVTIISKAYPVFQQQVYKALIPEYIPVDSSVIGVESDSPTGQKMIYTIIHGDLYGDFDVDYSIAMDSLSPCIIKVKGVIDYEMTRSYNLTVQATETLSGLTATTVVIVSVMDLNNFEPSFSSMAYTATVSEAVAIGTSVVTVTARDTEPGVNGLVHYNLLPVKPGSKDVDWFYIDPETGLVTTRLFLERETQSVFHFLVVAADGGFPSLSSTAKVKVIVSDLNNNAPVFDQPSYLCTISDQVHRGQLVTKVSATDPDSSSAGLLRYSIIGGNERQTFVMDKQHGIISLSEQRLPELHTIYELNISVSDGVFTNFARVSIKVQSSNNHAPKFEEAIYVAEFPENYLEDMLVTQVVAVDDDAGFYGMLTYTIPSDEMNLYFRVDADTGEIFSTQVLDREKSSAYIVPVAATDNGGRMGFTTVHIAITDQNDNIPQFLAQEYKATLLPDLPLNTTVLQIQAEDRDSGDYGEITYSISPESSTRILQMFHLDAKTGIVRVKESLRHSVNEIFQFFVQASDNGSPPMQNNVPVNLWVTDATDEQPKFRQDNYSFFMLESDPVSTVIATVTATSSVALEYIIVPGFTDTSNSPAKFGIDSKGRIHVAYELDRETTCMFTLTVQAQTLNKPPLVASTLVNIRLMDVNDNYPYFESSPYQVTVAENADVGIEVIKVVAHDLDKTSKFMYRFGEDMRQYSHIFGLDSTSGVITLLSPLDREVQAGYNLTVVVTDSDDTTVLTNSTTVQVRVTDHNDNPPVFSRKHYHTAVNEDAYPGTIVLSVITDDADIGINTNVRYYIIRGDPGGKFKVRKTGDVFVNRELDRELVPRYELIVVATDGAFVSTATVSVDILDANDNTPVCSQLLLYATVSEDISTTEVIVRVTATDADEYDSLRFQLDGDMNEQFSLEEKSGILSAQSSLDRETTPRYILKASAIDNSGKSCTTDIYITISDVNDNSPQFASVPSPVMIQEDALVNTLVYRVTASDADIGINRQIEYSLLEDGDGVFKINAKSGLIQLAKPLDRELTAAYKLAVMAADQGTPQLSSSIDLEITVLDINDNPPEFSMMSYIASVAEDAAIGQFVTRILATSKDVGVNAQISYYIQGGNDQGKFAVNETTGEIITSGLLDHEKLPGYVLTVRAQDHGDLPLSNTAYVQINVTDVNDSPPVFTQSVYSAKIREDVQIGTKVIQVLTSDLDSDPQNKVMNFTIQNGDHLHMFDIHRTQGTIVVSLPLDRESVSSYVLHVRATNYHLYADTMVNVEILDANDSPPKFSEDNYTIFVQEDKEITSSIMQFSVTDDDLHPNGAPFTFDIIQGDPERKFRIDQGGYLRIAGQLNKQVTAAYGLVVRVFDNGTPAMYSDVDITVNVIEESTFIPEVSNVNVMISSYLDEFPGGVVAKMKAVDGDRYDILTYEVVSPNRHLFDIDKKDGRIIAFAGLDAGLYVINVSVSDGKYTTYGKVDIEVNTLTEEMIMNSVTVRIENMEPVNFFKNYKRDFQRVIKRELNVKVRDVEILSVQHSADTVTSDITNRSERSAKNSLDVLFAVKRGSEYIPQNKLRRKVQRAVGEVEDALHVHVMEVFSDICEADMCEGGECAGYVEFDKDSLVPIIMDTSSFVAPKHRYTYECICPNGFVGDNCLTNPTSCSQDPCPRYKVCAPHPTLGYQCGCPPGKVGRRCEKDLDNRCDNTNCRRGDTPITFLGSSYARWTLTEPIDSRLSLSLRVKTRKDSASLMYAKGRVDYSILELVNGMVQYRFDCGSGEGLVMIPNAITDGEWHTVMVERRGNQAEIFLDGQYSSITVAPGINDVLNLDTSDVYFGAEVEMYANGYVDVRKGFRGCMEDIRIYNVRLPTSGSNAVALSQDFQKVEFSCKDADFIIIGNNVCSTFPCMNGGKCETTGLNSYICKCSERYRGAKCEIDTDPCQENPCLNTGRCVNMPGIPNEYICECSGAHKGRRCEYGRYCLPNPCSHGGTCIEGPSSFACMCRLGYKGLTCEMFADVCESSPCQNEGVCVQVGSLYTCNCTDGRQGEHCEDLVLPAITSNSTGINSEEIYAIAGATIGLILIVLIFVLVRVWRRQKRHRRRANVTAGIANDEVYLNLLKSDKHNYKAENTFKVENNSKSKVPPSPRPPPVPDRPASYTPSGNTDSVNALNNFDLLRNYGSAADELERDNVANIPPYNMEFLQTFSPPQRSVASIQPMLPPPVAHSDTDSIHKDGWESACQNILQNYVSDKHSDKMSKLMPVGTVMPMSHLQGHEDTTSFSSLPISESDDDLPGYHWDTSDWAPEKSLPNISEVGRQVCPDSPGSESPHSNESNTHVTNEAAQYTDGEYIESDYVGDSEFADNEFDMENPPDADIPDYEQILAEQNKLLEGYELPSHNINIHPNYYLPLNSSFTSENGKVDAELNGIWPPPAPYNDVGGATDSTPTSSSDDNDSVLHYGFPSSHAGMNRLSVITTDSDVNNSDMNRLSVITTDSDIEVTGDNRLSAAFASDGEYNGDYSQGAVIDNLKNLGYRSDMSDISGLCEIDDSEAMISESEDENTPLPTARIHTEV